MLNLSHDALTTDVTLKNCLKKIPNTGPGEPLRPWVVLIDLTVIILFFLKFEFSKNYLTASLYVKETKETSCASSMLKKSLQIILKVVFRVNII